MKTETMKFVNVKVHTSNLRSMLKIIYGKIVPALVFRDDLKESCIQFICKSSYDDYESVGYEVSRSNCHSKHRRYLELLKDFGTTSIVKQYNIDYSSLAELKLKIVIFGYG